MSSDSPYRSVSNYFPVAGLAAILITIAWLGWNIDPSGRTATWIKILILMTAFAIIVGRGVTGYWRGILIDSRNRMSLSRLQLLVWTLLVLSAIIAAVLSNVSMGWEAPLEITIPSELWTLMGISTAAAIGAPAVLGSKASKSAQNDERNKAAVRLAKTSSVQMDTDNESIVIKNLQPEDARWGDLLTGDETGNAASVDLGKLQMFFFTFILAVGYGAAIAAIFNADGPVVELPAVQEGMNVLLGISQTGYLASKAITHSKENNAP